MSLAILFFAWLGVAGAAFGAWETGVLDSNGSVGTYADARIDSSGNIHVVYYRADSKAFNVLSRISGEWQAPETPDDSGGVDGHCAIAVDGMGTRRVSYKRGNSLWYAGPEATQAWERGVVISTSENVGAYLELKNAPEGGLSLSCQNVTQGSLVFLTRDALGAWSSPVTVDAGPGRGSYSDHAHRPGVGYAFSERGASEGGLLFADPVIRTNAWSVGTIYEGGRNGPYVSLTRLPGSGAVACAFYHYDETSLGAVYNTFIYGLSRSTVTVVADSIANSASDAVFVDLAVSSGLDFAVSYRNTRDPALCCATADSSIVVGIAGPLDPDPAGRVYQARLYQNAPNPFNPSTRIRYEVPVEGGKVTIRIFDVAGRLVRTLVDGHEIAGGKTLTWDGTNERGEGVASGVYFCRMEAPGFSKTVKVTLVR